MRVLLVGAGGVGGAIALIAARRDVLRGDGGGRLRAATGRRGGRVDRRSAVRVGAGRRRRIRTAVSALITEHRCDVLMNATDPRFVMPLFRAALDGGANYLDMAMSLSRPHPTEPYSQTGVKLGDEQFALAGQWEAAGQLALVGMGIEPGMADVFARYAADELFSEIEELGVRDGAEPRRGRLRLRAQLLHLDDHRGMPQPAGDLREGSRLVHHATVQRAGGLRVPGRHRPGGMRQRRARGGAADAALDRRRGGSPSSTGWARNSSPCCGCCTSSAWTAPHPVQVGDVQVSPRDVVAAVLPNPAQLGDRMSGKTCAGLWVKGTGKDGAPARRCTCTTWSTTNGRCGSTAPRRWSGRPR